MKINQNEAIQNSKPHCCYKNYNFQVFYIKTNNSKHIGCSYNSFPFHYYSTLKNKCLVF